MGRFRKYFKRKYYRKYEKALDVKPVISCWAFNIIAALLVFATSWIIFSDVFVTVFYTLASWAFTMSLSVIYWVSWIGARIKASHKMKISVIAFIMILYAIGMIVVWNTFHLVAAMAGA